jgi:hypothetical protein
VDVAGEWLDYVSVCGDYLWLWAFVGRDEFGDVVDFRVVEDARGDFLY